MLLQRRGCPVWMQHMVDQLQCDSCLESSDAQNAQRVSLATPPNLWQALKVDSCFLEGNVRQRFELNGATLFSHLASDWMQHYTRSSSF